MGAQSTKNETGAAKTRSHYEVLEVEPTATEDDIRRAYRCLALLYHPDRNNGDREMTAKFQEINHAYMVLSDPHKRFVYDNYGNGVLNLLDQVDDNDTITKWMSKPWFMCPFVICGCFTCCYLGCCCCFCCCNFCCGKCDSEKSSNAEPSIVTWQPETSGGNPI